MRFAPSVLAAALALPLTLGFGLSACGQKGGEPIAQAADGAAEGLAPDFELESLDGKKVKLSDHKGKIVVLEWFNPGCPFVKRNHGEGGSLRGLDKKLAEKGVVMLAINSGKDGKQGTKKEDNLEAQKNWEMSYPVLRDESGATGKAYGAKTTPHMFVIDKEGKIAYAGAIDNAPDGDPLEGDKIVNYVLDAVEDLAAGREVKTKASKPYGCSVKY